MDEISYRYQVVQPDGNVATGFGTREEINRLKKNFQVRVEGEDADFNDGGSGVADLAKKAAQVLSSKSVQDTVNAMLGNGEKKETVESSKETALVRDEDNPFSQDKIVANVKHALGVIMTGSKDVLLSTAKNAWEAVVHAGAAIAGAAVIAVTGMVVKKTALMLPGAANTVGNMLNNALESTQAQVKLITAGAIDAVREAAAEAAKEEAAEAEPEEEAEEESPEDGVAEWVEEEDEKPKVKPKKAAVKKPVTKKEEPKAEVQPKEKSDEEVADEDKKDE